MLSPRNEPHDINMANRFLSVLTGDPEEVITFQTFDDKKKNWKLARIYHLKFSADNPNRLMRSQKQGCGVYVMVNKGDCRGRKAENVLAVRALFIDLDGSPWEPAVTMLKPHIMVESSPGRRHLYWKVSDCTLDQFKPLQQAIANKFSGDKACCDLSRVLRLPGFFHLKSTPFLTRLLELNDFPSYTVQQITDGLGLLLDEVSMANSTERKQPAVPSSVSSVSYEYTIPNTGEVIDLAAWAAKNPGFDIVAALNPHYARGVIKDAKQHIECPFRNEHTDESADLSTFIANASPPEHKAFVIHCMHAHCIDRDRLEFLSAMLERNLLSIDFSRISPPLQLKRPPKIYFPVVEVRSSHEWSSLSREEYRIALHLMNLSWETDDGTLPDDDWKLARLLGLCEEEWLEYRKTLIKTGWLLVEDGRLTNSIVKREYVNAQTALMKAITSGQKGGLAKSKKTS